jgi:hypothetical protein
LTVLEHEQLGLVGGYLILNAAGRPLEFHCTAPVKPNRAQQILFGPTLPAYLYGEQIGQTLLGQGSQQPAAVYTDVERVLAVRDFVQLPVALVLPAELQEGEQPRPAAAIGSWRVDVPSRTGSHLARFAAGRNQLAVHSTRSSDRDAILGRLEEIAAFDLAEPFERIREAVEEAHKGGRVDQAA